MTYWFCTLSKRSEYLTSASLLMFALFWTTVHNIKRQMRMKTQNMMVLTLEFTRTPLVRREG